MEIIERVKDKVNTLECTEKEKIRLTTVFIEASQIDYNKNVKESSKKAKLLVEIVNKIIRKSIPKKLYTFTQKNK